MSRPWRMVEILNENGLWLGFHAPTPYYDEELTAQYNAWLLKNRSPEEVAKLRALASVPEGAPVPRLKSPEAAAAPKDRYNTEMAFYMDTERSFYEGMSGYLKGELGVKCPIIGTADHSHTSSPYPMLASLAKLDILDGHVYWEHPGSPAARKHAHGGRSAPFHRGPAFPHRFRRQAVHGQRNEPPFPQRVGRAKEFRSWPRTALSRTGTRSSLTPSSRSCRPTGSRTSVTRSTSRSIRSA